MEMEKKIKKKQVMEKEYYLCIISQPVEGQAGERSTNCFI